LFFLLKEDNDIDEMMELAAQKDPGFDRYWFSVALNRVENYPDELNRWPVKMLSPCDPREIKVMFKKIALKIMHELEGDNP
jgi:hypothetical protein